MNILDSANSQKILARSNIVNIIKTGKTLTYLIDYIMKINRILTINRMLMLTLSYLTTNMAFAADCPQIALDVSGAWSDGGYAYKIYQSFGTPADTSIYPTRSTLRLFENGSEVVPAHSIHNDIRNIGQGRFSHKSLDNGNYEALRFSSTDDTDPRTNGRSYTYCTTPGNTSQVQPALATAPVTAPAAVATTPAAPSQAPAPTSSFVVNVKDTGATGNGYTNDTAAIQEAIYRVAGTGGTVLVPDGTYMIDAVTALNLPSNMTFKMTSGAVLKAITNSAEHYEILSIYNASNVNVIGGTLLGERTTHTGPQAVNRIGGGQWGYGIGIFGSHNIFVEGVTAKDFWGDGFYIGDIQCTNVTLSRVIADNNRRQGLSITYADGVIVRDSVFKNTHGHLPEYGIDVEPDIGDRVNNVQILNNQFSGNTGALLIWAYPGSAPVTNITAKNNRIYGGQGGFPLMIFGSNNNLFESNYIQSVYMGVEFRNGSAGNYIKNNTICAQYNPINGDNGGNILSGNILSKSGCLLNP